MRYFHLFYMSEREGERDNEMEKEQFYKDFLCHQRVDLGKNLYEETLQHDMREFSLMGKHFRHVIASVSIL